MTSLRSDYISYKLHYIQSQRCHGNVNHMTSDIIRISYHGYIYIIIYKDNVQINMEHNFIS
jgi:hypothetical protein